MNRLLKVKRMRNIGLYYPTHTRDPFIVQQRKLFPKLFEKQYRLERERFYKYYKYLLEQYPEVGE